MAAQTGLELAVCAFPLGTGKWNRVEGRSFSFISSDWCGAPLGDGEPVVWLIAGTTRGKGVAVACRLVDGKYLVGRKVTNEESACVNL